MRKTIEAAAYKYIIVGAGLTGGSAVEGIRERDPHSPILLIGNEAELPYDRPPLTKQLWFGKKQVADIYLHDNAWYETHGVQLAPATEITHLDPREKVVVDQKGTSYRYEKLLLATGGLPRRLTLPGGEVEGLCYYRYLADYQHLRKQATPGATATIIGAGFIGSELAAALTLNQVQVHLLFPSDYLGSRVFPVDLGMALEQEYRRRGVITHPRDHAVAIERHGKKYRVRTEHGHTLESDLLIAGLGLVPSTELARRAGLDLDDGLVVDAYLRTSHPDIYAAGDNASFPYLALDRRKRVEHWDNAVTGGKHAGRNMAGAEECYDHMPYFYSDLFDFGYEAVGEVESRLGTVEDWVVPYEKGVIYYFEGGRLRGAMMCNVWDKVEAARDLIRRGEVRTPEEVRGAIR